MAREDHVISAVLRELGDAGQAVRQHVTSTLDGNPEAPPDIVFLPDDPEGRVVCVEVRLSAAPTVSSGSLAGVLRHREVIERANPGSAYVLATNAGLTDAGQAAARDAGLRVVTFEPTDPTSLANAIRDIARPR